MNFPLAQLQSKWKHARQFGVTANWSPSRAHLFRDALQNFIEDANVKIIPGIYNRGANKEHVTFFLEEATSRVVVRKADGTFITGFKAQAAQVNSLKQYGTLGGG